MISNNLNVDKINTPQHNDMLLMKLNQIIEMFEEQKDIRTNQKNEETVLYCFRRFFCTRFLPFSNATVKKHCPFFHRFFCTKNQEIAPKISSFEPP